MRKAECWLTSVLLPLQGECSKEGRQPSSVRSASEMGREPSLAHPASQQPPWLAISCAVSSASQILWPSSVPGFGQAGRGSIMKQDDRTTPPVEAYLPQHFEPMVQPLPLQLLDTVERSIGWLQQQMEDPTSHVPAATSHQPCMIRTLHAQTARDNGTVTLLLPWPHGMRGLNRMRILHEHTFPEASCLP